MRIILESKTIVLVPIEGIGGLFWKNEDTIEIKDDEWDKIFIDYMVYFNDYTKSESIEKFSYKPKHRKRFAQYLKELIELAMEWK